VWHYLLHQGGQGLESDLKVPFEETLCFSTNLSKTSDRVTLTFDILINKFYSARSLKPKKGRLSVFNIHTPYNELMHLGRKF
jgi:hypothetical protein